MMTPLRKRLTDEQFKKLVEACCAKYRELKGAQEYQDWQQRRERFERIAAGDQWYRLEGEGYWRGAGLAGKAVATVFDKVNESLNIVQSVRRFLVARVCKDLFGSDPYFFAQPEGTTTKDLSLKLQKHATWKLASAFYKQRMKEAVGIALDLGECPIKTTWRKDVDISERFATLLTHRDIPANGAQAGQPVLTADGDNLEDSDETTGGDEATDEQGTPMTGDDGQPVMNPVSFVKAPEIQIDPSKHEWADHFVEERTVLFQGLDIAAVDWRDVGWPINAPSLSKADFVWHRFDMRLSAIRAKYAPNSFGPKMDNPDEEVSDSSSQDSPIPGADDQSAPPQPSDDGDAEVMEILDGLKGEGRGPKSHEAKPRPGEAEVQGGEFDDPIIQVAEVSYDFDCFEDGVLRRLWLVILPQYDQCIYANYRANISPRAEKAVHLVVVNKVKHRAYGKGLHETYEKMSNIADRLLCHILLRNAMAANPTKIWNPDRTNEGAANPTLAFGEGQTYSIKGSQWKIDEILKYIEMPDLDERTWKLMELFMQLIQVDSGVTNANQGDMTDLPSNTTATGVNSMLESSSVLHQYVLEEIRDSMTPHLGYCIELIYKMQDRNETFEYLEQDEPQPSESNQQQLAQDQKTIQQVMEFSDAKKLAGLPMQVEFLLTRAKRQEQRESATAGLPLGLQYGELSPKEQSRMRDCFIQLFRSLGFDDPDEFFPEPDLSQPPPQPPPPKASEVVQIPFALLAQNQRDALAQQLELPPAQGLPPPAPGAPQTPAGAPVSSSPQSQPPVLPSNITDDGIGDAGKIPDAKPFQDPTDVAAPQVQPPAQ